MSSNQGEDEEEEEESFYESFDRILSSSSAASSTAVSEDDDPISPNCAVPRFPKSVSNYDVWISEPCSIEERRKRLLCEMGLSNDPCLARRDAEIARSVSVDQIQAHGRPKSNEFDSGFVRSKSDSATRVRNSSSSSSFDQCTSSTIFGSIDSIQSVVENDNTVVGVVNSYTNQNSGGSGVANVGSCNKSPCGKQCGRVEEFGPSTSSTMNPNPDEDFLSVVSGDGVEIDGNCNGVGMNPEVLCKIKNLDDGKEFVVNEFSEDGMWNKVREVGTGRQLTIEEFDMFVGHSPIVQELMRRQNVEESDGKKEALDSNGNGGGGSRLKKKGGWFKSIRNVASSVTGYRERRSSDERDTSSEKGGRRSSSATDDSQDISFHCSEKVRVRQYGKSSKELTALYKCQEIQAHNGSIWSIKFSLDGRYLASAGEDCIIHIWRVMESEKKGELLMEKLDDGNPNLHFLNGSLEPIPVSTNLDNYSEKKRRAKTSVNRKSVCLDHVSLLESIFSLSDKPVCSFHGHLNDVLDLSWSKSQYLLSSSMDKTVRLWHMTSNSCLKMFSHSDYVTCIQFNPVDDRYFISGSLDAKVRIWSIPDRQVVDWNDLHEMVTAACYSPDGQCALVGSHKGSCRLYNTSENKLHQRSQIDLQSRKKRSHLKKITGFQFIPGSSSEVLVTSADSRIRVMDGIDLVHKFKGFRNTSSQISASLTANGKYVVCASEDSHVYVWKYEDDPRSGRSKSITVSRSYEHFHCPDVSVAIAWPGVEYTEEAKQDNYDAERSRLGNHWDEAPNVNHTPTPVNETKGHDGSPTQYGCSSSPRYSTISSVSNSYFFDRLSVTWPEEKLLVASRNQSPRGSVDLTNDAGSAKAAWGMVIVTADRQGEIKTYQNFGLPVRI